jgi:hypothetical protein
MRKILGLGLASFVLCSLPAFGGTFRYKIDRYPAVGDCHQIASELGERFERLAGLRPDLAICSDITREAFSFEITYTAEQRLPVVSTVKELSLAQSGAYSTLAACEAVRAAETEHFQDATGLEPMVSYCQLFRLGGEVSYDLRIDGIGEAQREPFHTHTLIFDRPVDIDLSQFLRGVKDVLSERGVDVRYATFVSGGPYALLDVLYYAEEKFELDSPELASLDSKQQCLEQLGFAQASAPRRGEDPVALYCASSLIGRYYVIGLFRDLQRPFEQLSAERFESYAQCSSQRLALVDAYNQRLGDRVAAGLCTKDENLVWRVRLLLK